MAELGDLFNLFYQTFGLCRMYLSWCDSVHHGKKPIMAGLEMWVAGSVHKQINWLGQQLLGQSDKLQLQRQNFLEVVLRDSDLHRF